MKPKYIPSPIVDFLSISQIVTIHFHEFGTNFHFSGEKHDFWEIIYVDKGQVHIQTDEEEFDLKQGAIAFHKPNEFHTLSTDENHVADVFVVSFVTSSAAMTFFENKIAQVSTNLQNKMLLLFQEGLESFEFYNERLSSDVFSVSMTEKATAPIGGQQLFKSHLEELLIMLIRQEQDEKRNAVDSIKLNIRNQIAEQIVTIIDGMVYEHISVSDLCNLTKYSRAHLAKVFKSAFSMTVGEYITVAKIKEAKKLIRQNKYTFQEIATMLKFENQHYFSRVFKKITNFSPTEYKNSIFK